MFRIIALTLLMMSPQIASAQGFPELQIKVRVAALSATTFEVIDGVDTGPSQMWCAAAQFAKRKYGVKGGQLWLAQGLGPSTTMPGRNSTVFSIERVPNEYKSVALSIRQPGQAVQFSLANSLCRNSDFRVRIREVS